MTSTKSNTAIDLTAINYTSIGRREKGSDLVQFFAEKVLKQNPESIEVVALQGAHKVIFSKIQDQVQVHHIKANGLNVAIAPVDAAELKTLKDITPEAYRVAPEPKVKKSTKPADRTVFAEDGTVLRQAPIGTIDRHYVWQLEVLANEFVEMDPAHGFGICLRPAMWKGNPVSIMMTVYTMGPEKIKAASPKKTKINLLGNPEKLEDWLAHVQTVYDECASRLIKEPIVHESGFQFDREAYLRGELVIVSLEKTELTTELIDTLKHIQQSILKK